MLTYSPQNYLAQIKKQLDQSSLFLPLVNSAILSTSRRQESSLDSIPCGWKWAKGLSVGVDFHDNHHGLGEATSGQKTEAYDPLLPLLSPGSFPSTVVGKISGNLLEHQQGPAVFHLP